MKGQIRHKTCHVEEQLVKHRFITSTASAAQPWLDEEVNSESQNCGHYDTSAVGLTAYYVLLYTACY